MDVYRKGIMGIAVPTQEAFASQGQRIMSLRRKEYYNRATKREDRFEDPDT